MIEVKVNPTGRKKTVFRRVLWNRLYHIFQIIINHQLQVDFITIGAHSAEMKYF